MHHFITQLRILSIALLLTACGKEQAPTTPPNQPDNHEVDPELIECYNNIRFDCKAAEATKNYFRGEFNGEPFCVAENFEHYFLAHAKAISVLGLVDDPNARQVYNYIFYLAPGDLPNSQGSIRPYEPAITCRYMTDENLSPKKFIESKIKVGDLPISANCISEYPFKDSLAVFEGFDFQVEFYCEQYGLGMNWWAAMGDQTGSFVRCTRMDKSETATEYIYSFDLQFQINLYRFGIYRSPEMGPRYWRTLKNGRASYTISIPKTGDDE